MVKSLYFSLRSKTIQGFRPLPLQNVYSGPGDSIQSSQARRSKRHPACEGRNKLFLCPKGMIIYAE